MAKLVRVQDTDGTWVVLNGPPGPQGPPGTGGSGSALSYTYTAPSLTRSGEPALVEGQLTSDTVEPALSSTVYMSKENADGTSVEGDLLGIPVGSSLLIKNTESPERWVQFVTTGEPVDDPTKSYVQVPVQFSNSSPGLPTDGSSVAVEVGIPGPQGEPGPAGPQGPAGAPGSSSSVYDYRLSDINTAPPALGQMRINAVTAAETTALYLSYEQQTGTSLAPLLRNITANDELTVQDKSDDSQYAEFLASGDAVDHLAESYIEVPVTYVSSNGVSRANQDVLLFHSMVGAQGVQGEQGPPGPQGTAGADGAPGPAGPQGPAGADGAQGPQGAKGDTGPQGTAGADGATGAQGIQGVQGPQGTPGPTGATGAQGPAGTDGAQGPKGDTGLQGTQGPVGATGSQGPQGTKGDTGATGSPGTPGSTGATGPGVAVGGTAGQVLSKVDSTNYSTAWIDAAAGGGVGGVQVYTTDTAPVSPNEGDVWTHAAGAPAAGASGVRAGYAAYVSGRYYDARIDGAGIAATVGVTTAIATVYAMPIPQALTISSVGVWFAGQGSAGTFVRYALYSTMTGMTLSNRIMNGSAAGGTGTGLKETTGTWSLPAGVIYVVVNGAGSGTSPNLNSMSTSSFMPLFGLTAANLGVLAPVIIARGTLNTDSGWSDTIDLTGYTTTLDSAPQVFIRVA